MPAHRFEASGGAFDVETLGRVNKRAFALSSGALVLDVRGMTLVVVCQTVWNLAVGIQLVRAKF